MLSRGVALKHLHAQLFSRRQLYCNTSWQERLSLSHKKVNVLVQSDGYQLIFRNNSTGKKPEPVSAKPNEKVEEKNELHRTTPVDGEKLIADMPTDTQASVKPLLSTKTIEVKTSKGILSVTTTIEDSKINDVIMEKTAALVSPLPVAKVSKEEMLKEAAKKLTIVTIDETKAVESAASKKKLAEAAAESVKKVIDVLKTNATPKVEATATAAQTTEATATMEAHVIEMKTKKKPISATVKAMEKLAQSTLQATTTQPKAETSAAAAAAAVLAQPVKKPVSYTMTLRNNPNFSKWNNPNFSK